MDVIQYQLDNGMRVILQPHHQAPVVACNVWVGVGSADETPQEAGLAHVHEHMLFKGTERRGVGQIAKEVEAAGGHINAFTSFDQTCYYVVMSSKFFDKGLDILADATQHSSFEADELGRELEVIQEEIKRGNDSPSRVASLKLFETAFHEHPYRLPVIGTKQSVDSFTRDHVVNFYRKHYVPSNMTVVLVGDFDVEDAKQKVERYFGAAPGGTREHIERAQEPTQTSMRVAVMDEAAQDTYLRIGFHVPTATHEDIPALELLGTIWGSGETSRLHQSVQRERQLVNGVYSGVYTPKDSGLFMVSADYQILADGESGPGPRTHEEVLEAVFEQLVQTHHVSPSESEIQRARTMIESQAIYGKQTIEGLAMKYGHFHMVTGDALFEQTYYKQLAQVTAQDMQRVARKYLTPSNCTVVVSHPPTSASIAPDVVESVVRKQYDAKPAVSSDAGPAYAAPVYTLDPAPAVELDADNFYIEDIEGGPLLVVQEDHAVEMFNVRALTFGGVRLEQPSDNGINSLLTDMLVRGTSDLSAMDIAMQVESMASSISGISGRNTFGIALTGLSKYLAPCLDLMASCWFDAQIPQDEFEREKLLHIQHIKSRQDQLGSVNFDRFAGAYFGDHPYSMPVSGTVESASSLTAEDLRAYFAQTIRTQRLALVVVGDVDAGQIAQEVRKRFTGQPASFEPAATAAFEPPSERTLVVGDLDKNQGHVMVGFDAPRVGSDDRYALDVLHSILSGQGGRLFMDLRDKQSLAYSVYASMVMGLEASTFTINIGTSPEKIEQAVRGIFQQVHALHADGVSDEEIEEAKRNLIGSHDIGLQRGSSRAMSIALDVLYGQGPKRMFEYSDRIEAVTESDVQRVIQTYLDPERAVVAITKPEATSIQEDLLEGV